MTTTITIANTDWNFLSDLKTSLEAAVVKGERLFPSVDILASVEDAEEVRADKFPHASVVYVGTPERLASEAARTGTVDVMLRLVGSGKTQEACVKEALRLKCGAMNAIETTPPTGSSAWPGENEWQHQLTWGEPSLQAIEGEGVPYAVCDIELSVGYVLDSATSH